MKNLKFEMPPIYFETRSRSYVSGPVVAIRVVNTTNEIKKQFELFKACDNVCSKNFEGKSLVVDGVEISGGSRDVSYQQILWHILLYGIKVKATTFKFDKNIAPGSDFTFRHQHTTVDGCMSITPMSTYALQIMEQNQKDMVIDRNQYQLGYSDAILIDLLPLSKVDIYLCRGEGRKEPE